MELELTLGELVLAGIMPIDPRNFLARQAGPDVICFPCMNEVSLNPEAANEAKVALSCDEGKVNLSSMPSQPILASSGHLASPSIVEKRPDVSGVATTKAGRITPSSEMSKPDEASQQSISAGRLTFDFICLDSFVRKFRLNLPKPKDDWRFIHDPFWGHVNGLSNISGWAIATNGIMVALYRNDAVQYGHLNSLIVQKNDEKKLSEIKPKVKKTPAEKMEAFWQI